MLVSIKPGRYAAAICEFGKRRDQTPWCRDRKFLQKLIEARQEMGWRVLYIVNAIVPKAIT